MKKDHNERDIDLENLTKKNDDDIKIILEKKLMGCSKMSANEIIDYYFNIFICTPYQGTCNLFKDYLYNFAETSGRARLNKELSNLCRICGRILIHIYKEIYDFTDKEISWFFNTSGVVTSGL